MPRRRGGKAKAGSKKPRPVKKSDGSIKKWNSNSDIPLDEVDQFHSSLDQILLEGRDDEYEEEESGEEVFALKGAVNGDDEDSGDDFAEGDEDDDFPAPEKRIKSPKNEKKRKKGKEVSPSTSEEEESEEAWGRGEAYNADELESEDEEGHELEEQEAKRLQAKARENMGGEDFGLKDVIGIEKDDIDSIAEPAPTSRPLLLTNKKSQTHYLEKTNPEALALARDWEDTAEALVRTRTKIAEVKTHNPDALSLGMLHLHYQALLSYTTMLAFYLHLRASDKYAQRPTLLQSHPIMQRLLTLKQALVTLEELDFAVTDDEDEDDEDDDISIDIDMKWDAILKDGKLFWSEDETDGFEENELQDLMKDAQKSIQASSTISGSTRAAPQKKRKVAKVDSNQVEHVFDLTEPDFTPSKDTSSSRKLKDTSDTYGESSFLQGADAADKSAKKKSLRFHTSKIENASARRQGARTQAAGGDDDIPYRERKKEKDARVEREAKSIVAKQGGADLDDVDLEIPVEKRKRQDEDEDGSDGAESPDDYYELVKKQSKEKKVKKRAEYEEEREAIKPDFSEDAVGPRSLTRAILANKGLTPHRPKSVRNPRVKKRQKFEKAKKKIASQKAVYKGGISQTGRYDGERSGISKVVKSVRLG